MRRNFLMMRMFKTLVGEIMELPLLGIVKGRLVKHWFGMV